MIDLGVNVDHVATVREAREIDIPDPVEGALIAERNGADGITIHLRLDRRHIQDRDLRVLSDVVKTRVNLEMAVTDETLDKAEKVIPYQATFVPERREEVTTEGGLDVLGQKDSVKQANNRLKDSGVKVSHFVDPDPDQINAAAETGAQAVELHTGEYAETPPGTEERTRSLERLQKSAEFASDIGLDVYAGHGLNYRNVQPVAAIDPIEELNIGHALVSRAVIEGMAEATSRMKQLMVEAAADNSIGVSDS